MIFSLLSKLFAKTNPEPKLVEGLDYRIEPLDDIGAEIVILRGPDAGKRIRIMVEELDEDRNPGTQESHV